mmetsp:Transcript_33878/g.71084  ORF Transcript_33878/g.71084 Transcript_33878/m.71084 type:complete len:248 (-) Transcript_33878:1306-2049(-)
MWLKDTKRTRAAQVLRVVARRVLDAAGDQSQGTMWSCAHPGGQMSPLEQTGRWPKQLCWRRSSMACDRSQRRARALDPLPRMLAWTPRLRWAKTLTPTLSRSRRLRCLLHVSARPSLGSARLLQVNRRNDRRHPEKSRAVQNSCDRHCDRTTTATRMQAEPLRRDGSCYCSRVKADSKQVPAWKGPGPSRAEAWRSSQAVLHWRERLPGGDNRLQVQWRLPGVRLAVGALLLLVSGSARYTHGQTTR